MAVDGRCTGEGSQVAVANVVDCVFRNPVEGYRPIRNVVQGITLHFFVGYRCAGQVPVVAFFKGNGHSFHVTNCGVEPSHSVVQGLLCTVMNHVKRAGFLSLEFNNDPWLSCNN